MTLNLPINPPSGMTYDDGCGNIWVYNSNYNSWTIDKPILPPIDNIPANAIWARTKDGAITSVRTEEELNLGSNNSQLDVSSFPEKT